MRFGFRGMSHIVSTGCTSSTDAIGYAFRNIQAGVLDTMVAGGVDAPIAPLILRGFMLMRIMSTRWNARAAARFAAVLARSRRLRDRRRRVVLRAGGDGAGAGPRRAHLRRVAGYGSTCEAYHRVRLEECGEEPARTIGMAHGGRRALPPRTCSTSTITARPPS